MTKITLQQIDQLPAKTSAPVKLDYDLFELELKTNLTETEQVFFINTIAEHAFIGFDYSPILRKMMTEIMFAKVFIVNEIDIPDEIDDAFELYQTLKKLELIPKALKDPNISLLMRRLNDDVDEKIRYEKQKKYALLARSTGDPQVNENIIRLIEKAIQITEKMQAIKSIPVAGKAENSQ